MNYCLECIKVWRHWIKPTSPFVATVSLIVMVASGLLKFIGNLSEKPEVVFLYLFWISLSVLLGMLFLWAPYKVWKRDTDELRKQIIEKGKTIRAEFEKVVNGYANDLFQARKKIEELQQQLKNR